MWSRERTDREKADQSLNSAISQAARPASAVTAPTSPAPRAEAAPASATQPLAAARTPAPANKASVLGPTLRFKGDLAADEDLTIQGRVEGSILHSKNLTIGCDGVTIGDIRARRIVIEGHVQGDLYALECVMVRETAIVEGNIFAPRVAIIEGARFNGRVDMNNAPAVPNAVLRVGNESTSEAELTDFEVDAQLSAQGGG
jgi:cytoskeletal protein CcmA (bactofilin family)